MGMSNSSNMAISTSFQQMSSQIIITQQKPSKTTQTILREYKGFFLKLPWDHFLKSTQNPTNRLSIPNSSSITQNYTSHFCFALVYYGQIRVNSKQQNTSYHVNFPAYASNTHYVHPLMTTLST